MGGDLSAAIGDQVEAPYIVALQYKGLVRCLQGRTGEGLALLAQAVDHARKLRHVLALVFALHLQSFTRLLVGEYRPAHEGATEALALANEHRLVFWIAGSKITLGCASVHLDPDRRGLDMGREGLREWRATAAALYVPTWCAFIADAALTAGDVDTASSMVLDAMALAKANHDIVSLSDLQRIMGDIAIRRGDPGTGKGHLAAAIATANEQGAHLYGLRAAISLARLLAEMGKREEARNVLEPMIGNFTEGQELADLVKGRKLLAEL